MNVITESRTSKSIRNAKIALLFYLANLILQFFSRKIFLDYLGPEVLGLNTTAQNLLGFLNLAELGIGGAISYTLYKPLYQNDIKVINEIVSLQGWLYRRVAYIVVGGACVFMCFFPMIFEKAVLPLWYTYGSFIVLLVASLLSYFVNYPQVILTADQKEYKITLNVQSIKLAKIVLQIVAIRFLSNGYVYWMILELLTAIFIAIVLNRVLKKEYPWLNTSPSLGPILKKKYPTIITKTKQIFFHKVSGFVLTQTSPLIIYAYASLTLVAIYGNYMLIITGVTLLMNAFSGGITAGIGNLVAENNMQRIKEVFWELTSCRIWLASIICFGIYKLAHSFIALWVGESYVIEQEPFIVLLLITFISLTRTNDLFIYAYWLYQYIWSPITEAILNLGLAIGLGYYYGLTGILLGTAISLLIIVCCWKPYFLYKCGFKEKISEYIYRYMKCMLLVVFSFIGTLKILHMIVKDDFISSYYEWGKYGILCLSLYITVSLLFFLVFDSGMRRFVNRIKSIIR